MGELTGSVQVDGASCLIHGGQVVCTPLTEFPDEEETLEGDEDDMFGRDRKLVEQQVRDYIAGFVPLETSQDRRSLRFNNKHNNTQPRRSLYDDSGNNIDVLVVWTNQTECRFTGKGNGPNCGLNAASHESMAALVDLLVAQSNVAFVNSGVLFTIRLVHAYRHPTYVEPASITTTLSQLRSTNDGIMDDVHQKRALYGADLVHMIIGTNGCGVAYLGPSKAGAFSVTRYTCAVGQYSFPHELAHSLVRRCLFLVRLIDFVCAFSRLWHAHRLLDSLFRCHFSFIQSKQHRVLSTIAVHRIPALRRATRFGMAFAITKACFALSWPTLAPAVNATTPL